MLSLDKSNEAKLNGLRKLTAALQSYVRSFHRLRQFDLTYRVKPYTKAYWRQLSSLQPDIRAAANY